MKNNSVLVNADMIATWVIIIIMGLGGWRQFD